MRNTGRFRRTWIAALALLFVSLPARGQTFSLRYTMGVPVRPMPAGVSGSDALLAAGLPMRMTGQALRVSDGPPKGVRVPAFTSRRPRFLVAALGDGTDTAFWFALDESVKGGGYDLLYADGNHNRDLTDEPPLRLTAWEARSGFQPVRLLVPLDGSRTLYHAALVVETYGPAPTTYRLQSWGYYSGEVQFGTKRYPVALVDDNANGRFNDRAVLAGNPTGDVLLMDVDGDGKFDPDAFAGPEYRPCARSVWVEGQYYALDVRADGAGLTVAPARVPLATLRSGYANFALMLASAQGTLSVRSENGVAALPLGQYRIVGWQIQQRDAGGTLWSAQGNSQGSAVPAPALSVQKVDVVLPRLGAPLVAGLMVQASGAREFRFSLRFSTASGEVVREVSRGGRRMPEPRLQVTDARGRTIASIPFHYG
jgi:hypothetical protein